MARQRKTIKRRNNKNSFSNYIAAGISLLVVAFLIGITVAYNNVTSEMIETDKETLCRVDGEFDTHIILIDITDGYEELQLKNMRHKINEIVQSLPKFSQVQLFFLKDRIEESLAPEIVACNPGTGEGVNKLYGNPELMKRKWNDRFKEPLNQLVNYAFDSSSKTGYGQSPIMEIIQSINSSDLGVVKGKKTFIVFSDMIQNSDNFSFLEGRDVRIDHRAIRLFKSMYFDRIKTDLTDVDVEINFLYRKGMTIYQTKRYLGFWKTYFEHNGAKNVTFSRIEG